uniref:Uncharacterized protein n=1 Tax=viral metagenome TaxID=1070528 RepID=A0A6C0CWU2_9ZZZZ
MIEILETYLKLSKDKESSLKDFLDDNTLKQINKYKLVDDIYLNDSVVLIKKNTLKIDHIGKVYRSNNNRISLRKSNGVNITVNMNHYYVFVKRVKNKNNDRIFYEMLLNHL